MFNTILLPQGIKYHEASWHAIKINQKYILDELEW